MSNMATWEAVLGRHSSPWTLDINEWGEVSILDAEKTPVLYLGDSQNIDDTRCLNPYSDKEAIDG